MTVGFDTHNLNAAVARVMSLAADREQERIWAFGPEPEKILLTDADQVREYLMVCAELAYAKAGRGVVAQVRDMVYFSVGVVFEENSGGMHPPPLCRSVEPPVHLAYFWQVL